MKKITFLLMGLFFIYAISVNNSAYAFSITKPINSFELLKYNKGSEFIMLSFKQFATLTGEKENLWNRLSFNAMKMRIKHDLKKNPNIKLSDYNDPNHKMSTGLKILIWVGGIVLLLLLAILIIFGGQKK